MLMIWKFFVSVALAAPIPMTSSSQLVSPLWGLLRSEDGFQMDSRKTSWTISEGPTENNDIVALFMGAERKGRKRATLTVRLDENKKELKPAQYFRGFLRLYQRLGTKILGHQAFRQNGELAYLIDVINEDLNVQSRQVLFFKDKKVAVINCQDQKDYFKEQLSTCNQLIKSFQWLDQDPSAVSIQR